MIQNNKKYIFIVGDVAQKSQAAGQIKNEHLSIKIYLL